MNINIIKNKNFVLYLLVFLVNFTISFSWFEPGSFIAFGDAVLRIPHYFAITKDLYLWYDNLSLPGAEHYFGLHYIFFDVFYEFLRKLNVKPWLMQALLDSALFGLSSISILYLLNIIFGNRLLNIIGVLLYLYNPYIATNLHIFINTQPFWGLTYALVPLLFATFIDSLLKDNYLSKVKFLVCSIFLLGIFGMGTFLVAIILFLILYTTIKLLLENSRKVILTRVIKIIFLLVFVNVWWLIPFSIFIFESFFGEGAKAVYTAPESTWNYSTIFNVLRLCNISIIYTGPSYYSYDVTSFYKEVIFILATVLLPIISFSSLIFLKRERSKMKKDNIIVFNVILLFFIFLDKNDNAPLGFINKLLSKFPIFNVFFVEPRLEFLIVFLYSVLATYVFSTIIGNIKLDLNKRDILTISYFFLLLIVILPPAFVIVTGGLVPTRYWSLEKAYISIPKYVHKSLKYVDTDTKLNRVLFLPCLTEPRTTSLGYDWGYYGSPSYIETILKKETFPFHLGGWFYTTRMSHLLPYIYKAKNNENFIKILKLCNVKYIIWQGDTNIIPTSSGFLKNRECRKHMDKILISLDKFNLKNLKFGKWIVFKMNSTLPRIYSTTNCVLTNARLYDALMVLNLEIENGIVIAPNKKWRQFSITFMASPPLIIFRKVNPTKYIILVKNAIAPFFLIFSENYHPKWKAYIEKQKTFDNEKWEIIANYPKLHVKEAKHEMRFTPKDIAYLFKKPLPERYHLLVNGYANAWYIDPKTIGSSNFTITLYFWPQSLFYLGLLISALTFLGCIGYLVYDWRRDGR